MHGAGLLFAVEAEDLAIHFVAAIAGFLFGYDEGVIAVAESSIRAPADAQRMGDAGFDAVLVGEALVRAPDPTLLVRDLTAATVNVRT